MKALVHWDGSDTLLTLSWAVWRLCICCAVVLYFHSIQLGSLTRAIADAALTWTPYGLEIHLGLVVVVNLFQRSKDLFRLRGRRM